MQSWTKYLRTFSCFGVVTLHHKQRNKGELSLFFSFESSRRTDVLLYDVIAIALTNFSTFVTEPDNHRYFAMSYTEKVLNNRNKRELIGILISLQTRNYIYEMCRYM